jgi:hypothetical protein
MKQLHSTILAAGACLMGCGAILAQAPPGPLTPPPATAANADPTPPPPKKPEIAPRKNIFGAWRINKDESDDGRKKLQHARDSENTNRGNGPYGSGPRVGGPWPGGGGYPGGGSRYPHDDSSDYDQMGDVVNPPREIKFTKPQPDEAYVELRDDREHRRMFYTDGRKLQKTKGPDYEEIAAKWDGDRLITDEKGAHNGKISRSFEVSNDGRQLVETVRVSDSKGNHAVNVQYVYDAIDEREFNR